MICIWIGSFLCMSEGRLTKKYDCSYEDVISVCKENVHVKISSCLKRSISDPNYHSDFLNVNGMWHHCDFREIPWKKGGETRGMMVIDLVVTQSSTFVHEFLVFGWWITISTGSQIPDHPQTPPAHWQIPPRPCSAIHIWPTSTLHPIQESAILWAESAHHPQHQTAEFWRQSL